MGHHGSSEDPRGPLPFRGAETARDGAPGRDELAEYESLADLFLEQVGLDAGRPDASATPKAEAVSAKGAIELIALGHLPVLASAWVAPYARHVADTTGRTVALVRVAAGTACLDLFRPAGAAPAARGEMAADVHVAIRQAAAEADLWLLRVDGFEEAGAASVPHVAGVRVLSGTDDAAVVSCYRLIKALAPARSHGPFPVKVAFVGAPEAKAADAFRRLRSAAESFLGERLPACDVLERVAPSRPECLFRGPASGSIDAFTHAIASCRPGGATVPMPSGPRTLAVPAIDGPVIVEGLMEGLAGGQPMGQSMGQPVGQPIGQPMGAAMGHVGGGGGIIEASPDAALAGLIEPKGPPALWSLVPSLSPVALACPYAPASRWALSGEGLHVLAVGGVESPNGWDAPTLGEAVRTLVTAGAWARDHADLIAMVHPALASLADRDVEPTLHLLTERPMDARGLASRLVRVHALVRVPMLGPDAWVATRVG